MFKKFRFIVLLLVLALVMSNVSMAATDKKEFNNVKNEKEFYNTIKKVEKYVIRNDDGTLSIEGLPKGQYKYLEGIMNNMDEINEMIRSGYLETDNDLRVYANEEYILKGNTRINKDDYVEYDVFFRDVIEVDDIGLLELGNTVITLDPTANPTYADSYSPPVGIYSYWWGFQIAIDNDTTLDLVDAMNAGAGASGIAAVLASAGIITSAAALPTGIAAGILVIGASSINYINRKGGYKGVYFRYIIIPTPVWYIWARS